MREYFKEKGFEFTDFQKATLIWNMPGKTRDEIFAALKELADTAKDEVTRQQILERIQFEEKQFAVFMDNSADKYVYVVVADNGKAISKEQERNIFEPFVCGDTARSSGNGNGLGLTISKIIIEKHGGKLYINNNISGYTKGFIVKMPLKG